MDKPSRSEKTQPGNPHELTIRQHVYPAKSIERFVEAGGVDLLDWKNGKRRKARPNDSMFCADRAWSHGAEQGFMKQIEDCFQQLTDDVLAEGQFRTSPARQHTITEFFALWGTRAYHRQLVSQTLKTSGTPRVAYTRDELENLEKNSIIGFRADGSIAARDIAAPVIRLNIDRVVTDMAGHSWGLLTAREGEFCVPDAPHQPILPITPTLAFKLDVFSGPVTGRFVATLNAAQRQSAKDYVFARNLNACPGIDLAVHGD
ncbi:hypothetical protein J2X73_004561 [Novosphingobium sp. 1748]|uniref:hypothetical protein n=1 Tax=Novosphingobium sp. 1748 TaxID=2817760 RepID=UPI002867053F|nr:hypothetical protein [Novosphingobium sp. 1748]MDR6710156.1 hypothetical protein [Novosphingobium sp. 1748]